MQPIQWRRMRHLDDSGVSFGLLLPAFIYYKKPQAFKTFSEHLLYAKCNCKVLAEIAINSFKYVLSC